MGEALQDAPRQRRGTANWPLLETRLRPPTLRHREVERARLLEIVDSAESYALTLAGAPAGYGKTTLLAQWFQHATASGRRVAWVTLDEMDTETRRVLSYIVAALERAIPELGERFSRAFDSEIDLRPALAVPTVVNEIDRLDHDVYLVLDDVHLIRDEYTLSLLDSLLRGAPDNLHLIFACREIPNIALARHRMQRELLEIGPADLQFTEDEAAAFFAAQESLSLTPEHVGKLRRQTDGWIAGLRLAALSIKGRPDVDEFIGAFSGRQKDVGQLLTDEVIGKQSAEVVEFLERTSVLSVLSPAICDHLTGRDDSAAMLIELENANFFVFPVDDDGEFFRMHRLLADHFLHRLDQRNPALKRDLNKSAAQWYRRNGNPIRAVDHALKSESFELAAEILDEYAAELFETGRGSALLSQAKKIPLDILAEYPKLQLKRCYSYALNWEFDEAQRILGNVREAMADETVAATWQSRGIDVDKVYLELIHRDSQLALLADDTVRAARLSREWLESEGEKPQFEQAVSQTSLLMTDREQYRRPEVESAPRIRALFEREDRAWATVWHDSIVGACAVYNGQLETAARLYREALDTAVSLHGEAAPTAAMPALLLAAVLYERNDLESAERLVTTYLPLADETGLVDQLIAGYVTAARLGYLKSKGRLAPAMRLLDTADGLARLHGFGRLRASVVAERMRLYLAAGDVRQAIRFGRAEDIAGAVERFEPGTGVTSETELLALSAAQLLFVRSKQAEAIDLLEKWRRFARHREAVRSEVRIGALLARAYLQHGERRKAQRTLRAAVLTGQEGGFVRTFVDAGKPVLEILDSQRPSRDSSSELSEDYRARILEGFGVEPAAQKEPEDDSEREAPAEMLSPRESEILVLVSKGLMNSQIADELGMSVGTVKWYMQQLFGKLRVRRRSQAVHRARQLGLIA